jgi:hypothetical protein
MSNNRLIGVRRSLLIASASSAVVWIAISHGWAIPVSLFHDTDAFIQRAHDIVIAKRVSIAEYGPRAMMDGMYPAQVEVLKVLKGDRKPGPLRIATIHDMTPGETYLIANTGGSAFDTDFLSLAELSVVSIPDYFRIDQLDGKGLKEQVHKIFAVHLYEVERKLRTLLQKQDLLERALADSGLYRFHSTGNIQLGEIKRLNTAGAGFGFSRFFEMPPGKLAWSHSEAGKSGYVYYSSADSPHWQYSKTDARRLEDLSGKPLAAKFTGLYSPGSGENSLTVKLGDVILARTETDPDTVYVLEFAGQSTSEEAAIRWATVKVEK